MAAKSMEEIADYLKKIKFRRKLIGGGDEADVWRQLELLQKEYRSAFDAQEAWYQSLVTERDNAIARLREHMRDHSAEGDSYD